MNYPPPELPERSTLHTVEVFYENDLKIFDNIHTIYTPMDGEGFFRLDRDPGAVFLPMRDIRRIEVTEQ